MRTAVPMTSGSTPLSCTLCTGASSSRASMPRVLALPSTRARAEIISLTYRPGPYDRQSCRKAALVTPAIGARTTGGSTSMVPIFSGGMSGPQLDELDVESLQQPAQEWQGQPDDV